MGFVKVSQLKKTNGEINANSLIYIVQDGKSYSVEFSVIKAYFKDSLSLGSINPPGKSSFPLSGFTFLTVKSILSSKVKITATAAAML